MFKIRVLFAIGAALALSACGEPIGDAAKSTAPAEPPPAAATPDVGEVVAAASTLEICLNGAQNTLAINQCHEAETQDRESALDRYVAAAREHLEKTETDVAAFNTSQLAWTSFRDSYCRETVGALYEGGTAAAANVLSCRANMAADRAHQIWADFLNFGESDPTLPAPIRN